MTQQDWSSRLSKTVARELRRWREVRGLSAQQLAEACTQAGVPLQRSVIANFENGRRSAVGVAELLVFAHVLNVPPVALMCPTGYTEEVEILPGEFVNPYEAAEWISGNDPLEEKRGRPAEEYFASPISAYREFLEELVRMESENDLISDMRSAADGKGVDMERADVMYRMAMLMHQEAVERLARQDRGEEEFSEADRVRARVAESQAKERLDVALMEHHRALELQRRIEERMRTLREYEERARGILARIEDQGNLLPPIPNLFESAFLEKGGEDSNDAVRVKRTRKD